MTKEQFRRLPRLVQTLCQLYDAMVVGSSVNQENDSDIDIVIPYYKWQAAATMIKAQYQQSITSTRFGGWRIYDLETNKQVDIWPCSLEELITAPLLTDIYWPKHFLHLRVEHDE